MSNRITINGTLNIYRESSQSSHLSAVVTDNEGIEYDYHRCPKCFLDLFYGINNSTNLFDVEYTAHDDGSYPRSATRTSDFK